MTDIRSDYPAIDRYLAGDYARVPGMSSHFAAAICGYLIRRQVTLGIGGDIVEIGAFEGRFLIALALGLAPGETALAIDLFDWPDREVAARFRANCAAQGLSHTQVRVWEADSRTMKAEDLRDRLAGGTARFFHIDGEHSYDCLSHDLELAHAVMHPSGVIAIDDMLHPAYPALVTAVLDYLSRHPELRLMSIIDREDVVAAAKFLLCRAEAVELYEADLMAHFAPFHFIIGGDMVTYLTLVLTPQPRLAEV